MFAGKGDVNFKNSNEHTTHELMGERIIYMVQATFKFYNMKEGSRISEEVMIIALTKDEELEVALDMIAGSYGDVLHYDVMDIFDERSYFASDSFIKENAKKLCLKGFKSIRPIK